jgi:hypothetical protein
VSREVIHVPQEFWLRKRALARQVTHRRFAPEVIEAERVRHEHLGWKVARISLAWNLVLAATLVAMWVAS